MFSRVRQNVNAVLIIGSYNFTMKKVKTDYMKEIKIRGDFREFVGFSVITARTGTILRISSTPLPHEFDLGKVRCNVM